MTSTKVNGVVRESDSDAAVLGDEVAMLLRPTFLKTPQVTWFSRIEV